MSGSALQPWYLDEHPWNDTQRRRVLATMGRDLTAQEWAEVMECDAEDIEALGYFTKEPVGELVELGDLAARCRSRLEMTRTQFGRALGVKVQTIAAWESGQRVPSMRYARRMAAMASFELRFELSEAA